MKRNIISFTLSILTWIACKDNKKEPTTHLSNSTTEKKEMKSGYSEVNGLNMYYEIYGEGKPIVLIHGGGSTIQSSFEKLIPLLSKNRKVIAVESQDHGRTNDRNADLSFEQDADDPTKTNAVRTALFKMIPSVSYNFKF